MTRLAVQKTLKLFIGGAFVRSESGRTVDVTHNGVFLANASQASRKDAREAVVAARGASQKWIGMTPYNRGQILYRMAEVLEGRKDQCVSEIMATQSTTPEQAQMEVHESIDRLVYFAGWADKYSQLAGSVNPVSGPYFNISVPEATGVVASFSSNTSALCSLVTAVASVIVTGNTIVAIAAQEFSASALTFAEVCATSDVPAGVVNILTGSPADLMPSLASHADVNGLDLETVQEPLRTQLQILAADTIKRVRIGADGEDVLFSESSFSRMIFFTETKTVWHTKSLM